MWPVEGEPREIAGLGDLRPERVLYDFDGPRVFTCRDAQGQLLLAYWLDEDEAQSRFLLVPTSDADVAQLEAGTSPVRPVLERQAWSWVVDVPHGQPPSAAWQVGVRRLPPDTLPSPRTFLLPTLKPVLVKPGSGHAEAFRAAQRIIARKGLWAA